MIDLRIMIIEIREVKRTPRDVIKQVIMPVKAVRGRPSISFLNPEGVNIVGIQVLSLQNFSYCL